MLEQLLTMLSRIVAPVSAALDDTPELKNLLSALGYAVGDAIDDQVRSDFASVMAIAPDIQTVMEVAADLDHASVADIFAAVEAGGRILQTLRTLDPNALSGLPEPFIEPDFLQELAAYLIATWLRDELPVFEAPLRTIGVLNGEAPAALDWTRLQQVFEDPTALVQELYGWPGPLNLGQVEQAARAISRGIGIPLRAEPVSKPIADEHWADVDLGGVPSGVRQYVIPILSPAHGDISGEVGVVIVPVPAVEPGASDSPMPRALLVAPKLVGGVSAPIEITPGFVLRLEADADLTGIAGVVFGPDPDSTDPLPAPKIALSQSEPVVGASLALESRPTDPWVLGDPEGLRLEVRGTDIRAEIGGTATEPDPKVTLEFTGPSGGLAVVVASSNADSFLSWILGSGLEATADLGLEWSALGGLRLIGSAGLAISIPIDLQIGPFDIQSLELEGSVGTDGLGLGLGVVGGVEIGPVAASADGLGLQLDLVPTPEGGGVFDTLDLALSFKPPTGFGVAVDVAGIVSGGGYLDIDPPHYSGVAQLEVLGVGLTAVGQISTELPGGVDGWSVFLSLTAQFTGVQLGFGFTLNGVGGLVGLHRSINHEALGDGVRTGALDSLLFPEDAIANAPQILADMSTIFPAQEDQFVFGPVVKIGWGTPTLVELDLGVIIELPDPIAIALLGSLEAVLPTDEVGLLELRVDVAGILNITEGTIAIDASLRDSKVAGISLTGDMSVRASFLENPSFLVSFGGFHPEFVPPDDFPTLQRLGVALDTGDSLRISLGGYFALTSNTVQFGAEFSFWASEIGFTAEGGTSLDALIQFKPFGFLITLRLWASISAGNKEILSVLVRGDLSGPNPWHVVGTAEFKLLGFDQSLRIEATVGDVEAEDPPETVHLLPLLVEELSLPDAWSAVPPALEGDLVVLRESEQGELSVHPNGRIEVQQRLVPLGIRLDQYGNAQLGDHDQFELTRVRVGAVDVDADQITEALADFAAAQFFDLDDVQKLEAPSFEQMVSGLTVGDDGADLGTARVAIYDHEVAYKDPNGTDENDPRELYVATWATNLRAVQTGPVAAARAAQGLDRTGHANPAFSVDTVTWVATRAGTGELDRTLTPKKGLSYYEARDAVSTSSASDRRVIVPQYELGDEE